MGNGSEGPTGSSRSRYRRPVGVPRAPGWCSSIPIEQHPLTNGIMQIDAKSKFAGAPRRSLGPCLGFEFIKATMGREIRKLPETTGWTHRIWICIYRICAVITRGCYCRVTWIHFDYTHLSLKWCTAKEKASDGCPEEYSLSKTTFRTTKPNTDL